MAGKQKNRSYTIFLNDIRCLTLIKCELWIRKVNIEVF